MRIWVTRTAPDNLATATRLASMGHAAICTPVLDILRVDDGRLQDVPDAIAFTSANGVRHHCFDKNFAEIPVFAVGAGTAEEAVRAGYRNVQSAGGDVTDLTRLLIERLTTPSQIVHFRGAKVAGDMPGVLGRHGHRVERRVVYDAHPVAFEALLPLRGDLALIDGIVVYSPRGAYEVAKVLAGTRWTGSIWCISPACAEEFADFVHVRVQIAAAPTEEALMALVAGSGQAPASDGVRFRSGIASPSNDNSIGARRGVQGNEPFDGDLPPVA